jgi:hypothetical protein
MLATRRSQKIAVVQPGWSTKAIVSESGLGFMGDALS